MSGDTDHIGEILTDEETRSLLETVGHGVLSLAAGDDGYGIPVSFGYDEADDRFLFEFLNLGESKKRRFVTAAETVTLTVYSYEGPERWESAIVTGAIDPVDAAALSERAVSSVAAQSDDGAEEIRYTGAEDLERDWYELRPTEITGRRRGEPIHESSG